ncbi:hypothetical protein MKW94_007316, partial [Papaver nudicaule]|nr:hypothetical protein [Papaver nudicaule]
GYNILHMTTIICCSGKICVVAVLPNAIMCIGQRTIYTLIKGEGTFTMERESKHFLVNCNQNSGTHLGINHLLRPIHINNKTYRRRQSKPVQGLITRTLCNTIYIPKSCIGIGTGHMGAVGWSAGQRATAVVVAAHDKDMNSLAVAPNDSLVCSGSQDRTARAWRLPDLVSMVVLKGHKRGICCVEFSPVDQCVITASGDKTIKICAISEGACLKTFEGHTSSVLRVSFLTRGTQFVSSGADGLVKLWTVKSHECIATYDQHEDKVWALAVGKKTEMLATGGGDAVVNLWHDSTVEDKEEPFRNGEEGVLKGQELENALSDANYVKAIKTGFELGRPHKLFELFSELFRKKHAEDQVDKAIRSLCIDELYQLFEYVREWNSKPKLCSVAQFVLSRVFSTRPFKEITEINGITEILEGLIPYTHRHFSRADRLERNTLLLGYTLQGMSVIEPPENNNRLNGKSAPQQTDASAEAKQLFSKKRKSSKSNESRKMKPRKPAYV